MTLAFLAAGAQAHAAQEVRVPHAPPPVLPDIKTPAPLLPPKEAAPARQPVPIQQALEQARSKNELPPKLAGAKPEIDRTRTFIAPQSDGSVWAMGNVYKAQFSPTGTTYFPNMGSKAPQLYPLTFRVVDASVGGNPIAFSGDVAAAQSGDAVHYDRGGLTETYEIRPDSIEQEFVFKTLPGSGDLVVRLSVATELSGSTANDGFRFSNELGYVSYGRAVAIDAQGRHFEAQTILDGDSIQIRVPAASVSDAAMPLTIDPVITTFAVDSSASTDYSPDVAFDATTGRYLVCWERVYAATDHDVWAQEYDTNGAYIAGSYQYVDYTTNYWANSRCANNLLGANFLVAAQVGTASPRSIWGALYAAGTAVVGPQFAISNEPSYDCINPDVGGDPATAAPSYFLVVWERVFTSTDHDVHAQQVTNTGTLNGGMLYIDNSGSTYDFVPTVSKTDGLAPYGTQNWTITWTREYSPGVDYDIWGSQVLWDGTITHATYQIDFTTAYDYYPMASTLLDAGSGERDYMTVYNRYDMISDGNIHARVYNGTTFMADADLSSLDTVATQYQTSPCVDSDGANYAVAYTEQYSTSTFDYDVYVSTFTRVGSTIKVSEAHQLLDYSTWGSGGVQIASQHGAGGSGVRSMLAWFDYDSSYTYYDIEGGIYDNAQFTSFCSPGIDAAACPCANPPSGANRGCNNSSSTGGAQLAGSGNASLSNDTVVFSASGEKPTATSIYMQGSSANLGGLTFGQGIRCAAGTLKRLYVKTAVGGASSAPGGGDANVHTRSAALGDVISAGENRYYLVYYRDPTVLGGCSATSTFNATQTVAASWIP